MIGRTNAMKNPGGGGELLERYPLPSSDIDRLRSGERPSFEQNDRLIFYVADNKILVYDLIKKEYQILQIASGSTLHAAVKGDYLYRIVTGYVLQKVSLIDGSVTELLTVQVDESYSTSTSFFMFPYGEDDLIVSYYNNGTGSFLFLYHIEENTLEQIMSPGGLISSERSWKRNGVGCFIIDRNQYLLSRPYGGTGSSSETITIKKYIKNMDAWEDSGQTVFIDTSGNQFDVNTNYKRDFSIDENGGFFLENGNVVTLYIADWNEGSPMFIPAFDLFPLYWNYSNKNGTSGILLGRHFVFFQWAPYMLRYKRKIEVEE